MNYIGQKTPKEAADFLIKHDIVDHADFGKITDMELINDWSAALFYSIQKYPKLRESMRFTGAMQSQVDMAVKSLADDLVDYYKSNGYSEREAIKIAMKEAIESAPKADGMAWTWNPRGSNGEYYNAGGIAFNESREGICSNYIKEEIESGFWAKAKKDVSYIINHEIGHQLDHLLNLQSDTEIVSLYKHLKTNNKIINGVSGYANTDIEEFIAECWAEFKGSKNPRKYAKFVGERIIERYNEIN